ncbi:hypothetical protein ATO13_03540 [Stappia sp. 22II-S9-Z10]|nr:hypothetical protein ATO13_03540 [Stappia sp. 22II-S9-Z10]
MSQQHVVVVPPQGVDSSRDIKDLVERLRDRGADVAVSTVQHAGASPYEARVVFVYRTLESVLVEAMGRGVQPSGSIGPWVTAATALLAELRARQAIGKSEGGEHGAALLVDMAELELHPSATADRALGRPVAGEEDAWRQRGRRVMRGDPVLRALARVCVAAAPKARKLSAELAEAAGQDTTPAVDADSAFLYYTGILQRRDPGVEDLAATALAEITAERDRARAETASLRAALAARQNAAGVTSISLGETFTHPAFHGFERTASGRPFRWMGLQNEAVIPTHIPAMAALKVTVVLEVVIDGKALGALDIGVNGRFATRTQTAMLPNGQIAKTAIVEMPTAADGTPEGDETLSIWLRQNHSVDLSATGDPRCVGCGISYITVEPAAPPRGKAAEATPTDAVAPKPAAEPAPEPEPEPEAPAPYRVPGLAGPLDITRSRDDEGREIVTLFVRGAFDEAAFHPLETMEDGTSFAWMGRAQEQAFTIVIPIDRPVAVEAHLPMVLDDAAVDALEIEFDQHSPDETSVARLEGSAVVKTAIFPAVDATRPLAEAVEVVLRAPHRGDRSGEGDPRILSVALSKLVVRQL